MKALETLLVYCILFFSTSLFAQGEAIEQGKTRYAIQLGAVSGPFIHGINPTLNWVVEKNKNKYSFGAIAVRGAASSFFKSPFLINGLEFGYEFDPYEKGRRFEFYFFYRFDFYHLKQRVEATVPSSETSTFHVFGYLNTFGSGFRINMGKQWYLNNCFGFGPQFGHGFVHFKTEEDQSYFNFGMRFTYSCSIGFRFKYTK